MEDSSMETFDLVIIVLAYGMPVVLAVCGLIVGTILERRHFRSIREREQQTAGLPAFPTKRVDSSQDLSDGKLVMAGVVVSLDYFKRILASLRNIFGGRVGAYESLLDRAKREAILRLKEQSEGYDAIVNLRLETANLAYTQSRKKGTGGVEVLAYGTAIRYKK